MRKHMKSYQQVNKEGGLLAADPHIVISMLFNGVFESLSIAKGSIERKDLESKSKNISKAVNILRSLQDSLDVESQPEISATFYNLYDYCIGRLVESSVKLNIEYIDEVVSLLKPLSDAWKNIPEEEKKKGLELLKEKSANS